MSGEAESYCVGVVNLMFHLMWSGGYKTDTVYNKVEKHQGRMIERKWTGQKDNNNNNNKSTYKKGYSQSKTKR